MTINSLDLCDQMRPLLRNFSVLETYIRNGQVSKLANALAEIQSAAREAEWICNDILRGAK